jgi:hypothetical protein
MRRRVATHLTKLRSRINSLRSLERYLQKEEVERCAHLPKFWELVDAEDVTGLKILLENSEDSVIEAKSVRKLRHIASNLKIPHYGKMSREDLVKAIKEVT